MRISLTSWIPERVLGTPVPEDHILRTAGLMGTQFTPQKAPQGITSESVWLGM